MDKQITSPVPIYVNQYRLNMNKRLGRIGRRLETLRPLLASKAKDAPAELAQVPLRVEDDFAHIISEMKNIRHDFGAWCKANGQPKTANQRMQKWSQSRLPPKDQGTWELIREIRDFDVHKDPVVAERMKGLVRPMRTRNGGILILGFNSYAVKLVLKDGSLRKVWIRHFCEAAERVLRKFVNEFEEF